MDKYSRSVINEEKHKFVAPKLPRQNHESEQSSSNSLDRSKSHKSKSTSSSSSSKHHSSSSKHSSENSHRSSTKSSEHQDKDHKKKSDNKPSDKQHSNSHKTSHKRSREEVESKDTEPKSKKIKSDAKSDKQSSSRSSSSKSSSSEKNKSTSSTSSRHSKSKPAQIHISTPDLLTQKPKLDLSPDLVNDLNVSAFDFPPPLSKSSNNNQPKQGPTENELLTKSISSIKSRTRIFSGNTRGGSAIPKLNDMCLRVLTLNLDYVGCIGDIPFDILRPALEKAKPEQLTKIEYYNPYLLEDSDVLWKAICQRKWRNRQPVEMESWREMYERCNREDEEKLNRLTKNIRQTQQQTSNCLQRTKIAFVDTVVKAPRGIVRKPVETFSSTRKPVMSLTARIEALKSSKPNFVAPKDVQSKIAASFREGLQPIVKRGTIQRTTSTKPAPMMAKLLSKFRR